LRLISGPGHPRLVSCRCGCCAQASSTQLPAMGPPQTPFLSRARPDGHETRKGVAERRERRHRAVSICGNPVHITLPTNSTLLVRQYIQSDLVTIAFTCIFHNRNPETYPSFTNLHLQWHISFEFGKSPIDGNGRAADVDDTVLHVRSSLPQKTRRRTRTTGWTHETVAGAANWLLGAGAATTSTTDGGRGA